MSGRKKTLSQGENCETKGCVNTVLDLLKEKRSLARNCGQISQLQDEKWTSTYKSATKKHNKQVLWRTILVHTEKIQRIFLSAAELSDVF